MFWKKKQLTYLKEVPLAVYNNFIFNTQEKLSSNY